MAVVVGFLIGHSLEFSGSMRSENRVQGSSVSGSEAIPGPKPQRGPAQEV